MTEPVPSTPSHIPMIRLSTFPDGHLDRLFFYYLLNSYPIRDAMKQRAGGSTVIHLKTKEVQSIAFGLPPLSEQRRIAGILSSVDEAIQKTQAVIEQTDKIWRTTVKGLVTRGFGADRLIETDLGPLPSSWRFVQVGEVARAKGGKRMPKGRPFADGTTPFPYIRVSDFKAGSVDTSNLKYVEHNDREEIKNYTISSNNVYISIAGTIGVVGTIPPDLDGAQLTENAAKLVIIDEGILSTRYLAAIMGADVIQHQIAKAKGIGGGVPKLALFRIEQMIMPLPPRAEQDSICDAIDAIASAIRMQRADLEELVILKAALMSDLLTGRKRVSTDLSIAAS